MIDIYRMSADQTVEMIEQLKSEVGWSKFELLHMIRDHLCRYWNEGLDRIFEALKKDPIQLDKLFWHLISEAPFKIRLDNLDDREGCVLVETNSKILAVHDQTIGGSRWEAPDDLGIAYAMPSDHPGLLKELEKDGYVIDDSEYCPPDAPEPTCNS